MSVCQGLDCNVELPPSKGGPARKWCSEQCRKVTMYGADCESCGKRHYSGGRGRHAAPLCGECSLPLAAAKGRDTQVAAAMPRYERIAEMYRAGVSWPEMIEREGVSANHFSMLMFRTRQLFDLPHRYSEERVKKSVENRWKEPS